MTTIYSVGTVTVANGGTTVTGVGTSWIGKLYEGDLFTDPAQGLFARITADATSNTSLTINPWPGVGLVADAYEVLLQQDSIRMSERMRQYVELAGAIANTGIGIDAFGNFADRDGYDDASADFAFLSLDGDGVSITTAVVFIKASSDDADWSDPILVQGDKGDQGEPGLGVWEGAWVTATAYAVDDIVEHEGSSYICVIAHTSGTFATDLAAVKWELVVEKGDVGVEIEGDYSGALAYVKGDMVQNAGSSWIALQATTGNAPPTLPTTSNAYWQLLARQGIDGAGTVNSVVAGDGIVVDITDPTAPIVSATPGRKLLKSTQFTSGATWTPDPDTALVLMVVQGAGGGGGGSTTTGSGASSAAGGGGGGYQERWLEAGWGATETVTVGAAGAGGTGNANGANGGATSIGTLCVAAGGQGGGWSARTTGNFRGSGPSGAGGTTSGSGGTSAGIDVSIPGAAGGIGARFGVEGQSSSGAGGGSALGLGGPQAIETDLNGKPGTGFGSGGSGAATASASGGVGGNGTAGIAIIVEYA